MDYTYDRSASTSASAYSYDHRAAAAASGTEEDFTAELKKHVKLDGRTLRIQGADSMGTDVYVNFYNLPEGVGGAGGGAEAENNRMMFAIRGFKRDGSPTDRVKIEQVVRSTFPREMSLRAKSGPPAAIAKYLADYISKIVREVEPKLTHTGR